MLEFAEMIKKVHPGIFVHLVYIEEDEKKDREAGFVGLSLVDVTASAYYSPHTSMAT
jgi:hypothetical protein